MMNIEMIRGDTKKIKFQRKRIDNTIIKEKADKMYFTVKRSYYSKSFLFQKRLNENILYNEQDNYYYMTIEPSDTDVLDYNAYVFDIEVIKNGEVKTIARGNFIIDKEVTFAENEV